MKRLVFFLCIALPCAALDLIIKAIVFHTLGYSPVYAGDKVSLIPNVLELRPQMNTGIVWGLFQGANIVLLLVISILAIPLIILIFLLITKSADKDTLHPPKIDWLTIISLGLILGGAIGNLADRIYYGGVRDFIHYYYLIDWPTFNLADTYITCGAILMMITLSRKDTPAKADNPK